MNGILHLRLLKKEINVDEYNAILMEKRSNGKSVTRIMNADEYGVDDINFMDVSSMLYEEREEAIANMFRGKPYRIQREIPPNPIICADYFLIIKIAETSCEIQYIVLL